MPLAAEEQAPYLLEDSRSPDRPPEEGDAGRGQETGIRAGRGPAGPDPGPGGGTAQIRLSYGVRGWDFNS